MSWRRQPAVLSPVSAHALADGLAAAVGLRASSHRVVASALCDRYGCLDALLTDSGTSALTLALRKLVPRGGTVAYPAYSCIDLTTAALGAGVRVRLYDVDPATLSPDLDSVRATIARGIDAIVVAHLYGYPADVISVARLAAERGIPVIEDAAQGAGGTLGGRLLGSIGDLAILSFGRGKGTTAGRGGAVLVRTPALAEWTLRTNSTMPRGVRGANELLVTAAQRLLSHPSVYRIPSSVPGLRLGEMVYHAPRLSRGMAAASAAILCHTLAAEPGVVQTRRERAIGVLRRVHQTRDVTAVRPVASGEPGFLRVALTDNRGSRRPSANLGVLRGYPMTLGQHTELGPALLPGERDGKGSEFLRDRLFTIPTHQHVGQSDLARLTEWLEGSQIEAPGLVPVT